MMGFGFGMGLWGLIGMIIFWIILVAVAVWLVKLLFPTAQKPDKRKPPRPRSAEEILKTRYMRGVLTEEQYQKMRQNIQQ